MKNIQQALSMVDRMIMVASIGILAAVAIPAYGYYAAHEKAAQASTQLVSLNMSPTELYISLTTGYY